MRQTDRLQTISTGREPRCAPVRTGMLFAYPFATARTIVDIWGGERTLVQHLLPLTLDQRGVVVEAHGQWHTITERLVTRGIAHRCTVLSTPWLRDIPPAEDLYLLTHVLGRFYTTEGIGLLRACRRALAPHSRLLIIESVAAPHGISDPERLFPQMQWLEPDGGFRSGVVLHSMIAHSGLALTGVYDAGFELRMFDLRLREVRSHDDVC